jgi:hypothetical protein
MPDEKSTLSPAEQEQNTDGTILLWLTLDAAQRPWSVEEVIRELGNRNNAIDAIARLYGVGLIHRTSDDFVWATRAAIRADEIAI